MDTRIFFFVVLLTGWIHCGKHDKYRGYTVHSIKLKTQSELELLQNLVEKLDLDVWQPGVVQHRDAHIMVDPEHSASFLEQLDAIGMQHELKLEDIPKTLEDFDESVARYRSSRSGRAVPFEDYPTYAEVDEYLERIAAQYPDLVTLVNAGPSFEGRAIKYLKISTTNFSDTSKPIYFMDAMIHAREWVTTPVALYSIHRLVEDLRDQERDLLEEIDWIIHPIVNPDGYEYSHTTDRMWRKTRSINLEVSETCVGVDGNRNFDIFYAQFGVSMNPCAETYPGTGPFSEPETRIVRDILHEYVDRIQVYLNMHSYGNMVLFPYADTSLPENTRELHHVGATMGAQIDAYKLPQAPFYMVGNSALVLYAAAGGAEDYGQHVGVPFSLCLELPGYNYFFLVPPEYIAQMNEETWRGIVAQARLAKLHYNERIGL